MDLHYRKHLIGGANGLTLWTHQSGNTYVLNIKDVGEIRRTRCSDALSIIQQHRYNPPVYKVPRYGREAHRKHLALAPKVMYHLGVPRPIYVTTLSGMRACLTALGYSEEAYQSTLLLHQRAYIISTLSGLVPWLNVCCIASARDTMEKHTSLASRCSSHCIHLWRAL